MAKILLVEDDPMVIEALSCAIESKGHSCVKASNGLEGMKAFLESSFDLVITDIIMPDQEGIGMMLEMRAHTPDVRIVAISGGGRTGSAEYLTTAQQLGAVAVLKKPIRLAELFSVLDDCLADAPRPAALA
jgi:YesN/AraC family two-component response regulator